MTEPQLVVGESFPLTRTEDDVVVKPPKPLRDSSIWFYSERQRGLSRRDPHQGELELAVIPMRPRTGTAIATERASSN